MLAIPACSPVLWEVRTRRSYPGIWRSMFWIMEVENEEERQ
jgi:hypothetical protein